MAVVVPRIPEASGPVTGQMMALIESAQGQQSGMLAIWPPEKSARMG
jgi:hypothetical protein